jgi:putative flippase GtrA
MGKLNSEFGRFMVVGLTTVGIDFAVYSLLLLLDMPTAHAKVLGFLGGSIFAYVANRFWTFDAGAGKAARIPLFLALYASTLGINVAANETVLALLGVSRLSVGVAFVIATGLSATLNFLGMKFVVFHPNLSRGPISDAARSRP